jgi:hypothetical protein
MSHRRKIIKNANQGRLYIFIDLSAAPTFFMAFPGSAKPSLFCVTFCDLKAHRAAIERWIEVLYFGWALSLLWPSSPPPPPSTQERFFSQVETSP